MAGQWYMAIGGHQVGPVSEDEIRTNLGQRQHRREHAAVHGGHGELDAAQRGAAVCRRAQARARRARRRSAARAGRRAHDIDFKIIGEDMQFVEVELDPGESAVAEAGALMYMTPGIQMETVFGDGSQQGSPGIMGALLGAGKRLLTGESLFMTVFTNAAGPGKQRVAFAAPVRRAASSRSTCRRSAVSSSARRTRSSARRAACRSASRSSARSASACSAAKASSCSGSKATASASCTPAAWFTRWSSRPGETLRVDTGCLVALQPTVQYDIQFVGRVKTALFGGEGLFFATLTGPGKVWLQSLPLSRLADRIYKAAPQTGRRKDEGSVLDRLGVGNLIDGD